MERELNLDVVEGACLAVQRYTHLQELRYWEEHEESLLGAYTETSPVDGRRVPRTLPREVEGEVRRIRQRIANIRDDLLTSAGC